MGATHKRNSIFPVFLAPLRFSTVRGSIDTKRQPPDHSCFIYATRRRAQSVRSDWHFQLGTFSWRWSSACDFSAFSSPSCS